MIWNDYSFVSPQYSKFCNRSNHLEFTRFRSRAHPGPWYFDPEHSPSAKIIDMFDPEILGIEGPTRQTGFYTNTGNVNKFNYLLPPY